MPFVLLLLLSLTRLQPQWNRPDWLGLDSLGCAILTWVGIVVLWLAAALGSFHFRRRLLQEPGRRGFWMRRFAAWKRYHLLALLCFYLGALYFLGWGWTIKETLAGARWAQPSIELAMLAPIFMGLLVCWTHYYDLERAAHQAAVFPDDSPFVGRWGYVLLQARHNLLLIVPPLFVIVVEHAIFAAFPGLEADSSFTLYMVIGILLIAFFCIPLLLRWFLGLKPLPSGPLRDRLEATARGLRFRYNDILLWNTRSTIANAMVTGVVPWIRYIVVSDRLVEHLTEEEIEAVFGHEVGHIKHHHMTFYMVFLMASLIALGLAWFGVLALGQWLLPEAEGWTAFFQLHSVLPQLLLFAVYMVVVFGYLSRRCERQADIFGCRTVSAPSFISALEKVAVLNGIPRERPGWLSSWQHGTIAQRVAFLERMQAEPELESRFQRRLGVFKWGLAAGLLGLTALGWIILGPHRVGEILNSGTPPPVASARS
ncbi:MAG: M48 family metalloprotease [Planctomycetes bacterium]|nr:M48 family metalloprotease [Planctomycetota bacterium]